MRFLVTGSLSSGRGPRQIVAFFLLFIIAFTVAHALQLLGREGDIGDWSQLARSKPSEWQAGDLLIALETVHIDLFLFGLVALVLTSCLHQLPIGAAKKMWIGYATYGAAFLSNMFHLFLPVHDFFAAAMVIGFITVYLLSLFVSVLILRFLFARN